MTTKVLEVKRDGLRSAAKMIETEQVKYQWGDRIQCNCGILAQAVLKIDTKTLRSRMGGFSGSWKKVIEDVANIEDTCPISHLPILTVMNGLRNAGFSDDELENLENLSDTKITNDMIYIKYVRIDAVRYMKRWADQLDATVKARKKRKRK